MTSPSIRSLAAALGLSRSTVSCALRGSGRISAATTARVLKAAERLGYKHNPLAALLMSDMRRSRGAAFRGLLAAIHIHEPERAVHGPFHAELMRGAGERARTLGFKLEEFVVNNDGLTLGRLDSILRSRNIVGLLLLPVWKTLDLSSWDWSHYAGVYTDYNLVEPDLHTVCSDHYESMLLVLERMAARGYRRPGLFIEKGRNERLHRRHTAAFQAFFPFDPDRPESCATLVAPEFNFETFKAWFLAYQPDVVFCHFTCALEWMEKLGARVPATHGFVLLNTLHQTRPCAGLDLQPREIGSRAVELIVGQVQHNKRGRPATPTRSTLRAHWIEGPTVRPESKLS